MRLIDADEFSALLSTTRRKLDPKNYKTAIEFYTRDEMLLNLEQVVRSAPTIDPVKHGRWETTGTQDDNDNITTVCSECGHTDTHSISLKVPYCWFCGARMDGDGNDNDRK